MKTKLLLLPLMAIMLQACKRGNTADESRDYISKNIKVDDFTDICIEGRHKVYFTQGNKTSVKVTGSEEDITNLNLYTKDNTLYIGEASKEFSFFSIQAFGQKETNVYVTSPNIRGLYIAGSGCFYANSNIDTDKITLKITGSGNIKTNNIICDKSSISVVGSGNIEIGNLTTAKSWINIPGSGSVSIRNARINDTESCITGSGLISIYNANINHANNKITGSGTIEIEGNVKEHHEHVSGSGTVNIK